MGFGGFLRAAGVVLCSLLYVLPMRDFIPHFENVAYGGTCLSPSGVCRDGCRAASYRDTYVEDGVRYDPYSIVVFTDWAVTGDWRYDMVSSGWDRMHGGMAYPAGDGGAFQMWSDKPYALSGLEAWCANRVQWGTVGLLDAVPDYVFPVSVYGAGGDFKQADVPDGVLQYESGGVLMNFSSIVEVLEQAEGAWVLLDFPKEPVPGNAACYDGMSGDGEPYVYIGRYGDAAVRESIEAAYSRCMSAYYNMKLCLD